MNLAPNPKAALTPAQYKNHRQSERVFLSLPICISGVTENGKDFVTEGCTVEVSLHGASITVGLELHTGQNIKIRRVGIDKEAMARVVSPREWHPEGHLYGVMLLDPTVNLWEIGFPSVTDLEKAVLRALLRCIACERLEVSYLNEFEADLFLQHLSVARVCDVCGGWTTWTRPYGHVPGEPSKSGGPDSLPQGQRRVLAVGRRNQRSHERIKGQTIGCVRHAVLGKEVVLIGSLARGGLSFFSASNYPEGSRVEMAVPYTSKAPNIYSSARIVSSRKSPDMNLIEYGAAYVL